MLRGVECSRSQHEGSMKLYPKVVRRESNDDNHGTTEHTHYHQCVPSAKNIDRPFQRVGVNRCLVSSEDVFTICPCMCECDDISYRNLFLPEVVVLHSPRI